MVIEHLPDIDTKAASNGSVIDRPDASQAPGGSAYTDMLLVQFAQAADDFAPWGSPGKARDRQLRAFWPTESHFASALGAICARNAAYPYQLVGGPRTVRAVQNVLENANEGEGWHDLILKVAEDLLTQDNGAFIETVRNGDSETAPLVGLNHLDSARCWHTGDPRAPVFYEDRLGRLHLLKWYQVVTLSELPSPVEAMYGRQMSALSRVLKAAQILRDIMTLQSEKAGGRHTKAIHVVKGITTGQLKDALTQSQLEMDARGMIRYSTVPIVGVPEPEGTLQIATLNLASLPENWSEEEAKKWYYILLALGFMADPQDLAPIQGGSLGSGQQSQVLHLKGQAKGAGLFRKLISHAMNQKILPKNIEFTYDVQDVDADQADALLNKTRVEGYEILKRAANLPDVAVRQMALDDQVISQELFDSLGELDITAEVTAQDEDNPEGPDGGILATDDGKPPESKESGVNADPFDHEHAKAVKAYAARVAKGLRKIRANVVRELPRMMRGGSKEVVLRSTDSILSGFKLTSEERFWRAQKAIMLKALGKGPQDLLTQGVAQAQTLGVDVSFALVNKTVVQTVAAYTDPWWEQIEQTTRDSLRSAISNNIETGKPLKDLVADLEPIFGKGRAELIATTEVTNLFTQGNDIAYQAAGVEEVDFQTANDDLVEEDCLDAERGEPVQAWQCAATSATPSMRSGGHARIGRWWDCGG